MKKLIKYSLFAAIISLTGCSQSSNKYFIVDNVSLSNHSDTKYCVELRDDFQGIIGFNRCLYTDSVFTAGDTIKFHK